MSVYLPMRLMMRTVLALAACSVVTAAPAASNAQPAIAPASGHAEATLSATRNLLTTYCQGCHNTRSAVGRDTGLAFDALTLGSVGEAGERWETVVRRLRTGTMPPVGRPRPDPDAYHHAASWLETQLDAAAATAPDPGRPATLHRLNRTEYRNAVRDILALDIDVSALLPPDTASYGFDNIGDVLGVSPLLLESYLSAASKISRLAVARDPAVAVVAEVYEVSTELTQSDRLEGLPFGTRGGTQVTHHFPVDGEYAIRVKLARGGLTGGNEYGIVGLAEPHQLEITVDGARLQLLTAGTHLPRTRRGRRRSADPRADADLVVRTPVRAGPRTVAATFLKRPSVQVERIRRPFQRAMLEHNLSHELPYVGEIIITGPYDPRVPDHTPSRDRIFSCRPVRATEERACAAEILTAVARRAYRRPLAEADLRRLWPFYEQGLAEGGFYAGIERALTRILSSPSFLFRIEADPPQAPPGAAYRIDDLALASRLSFFLWSSVPDEELLALAERRGLRAPGALDRQVRRMLADPRARALVTSFAAQWLYLRNVAAIKPDFRAFPEIDDNLRRAFRRETELLFEHILREDRSVVELLTADYTFVNERLARHYGVPHVYGDHFRRVSTVSHPVRGGLLGQGSFLTVQSTSTRTSPVKRGVWILENVLGMVPPDPPADVPPLEPARDGAPARSMRAAMEAHRANPACAACHHLMDPLGLALENFDAVGRWRDTTAAGEVIDAAGALPNGTAFAGAAGLKQALLTHRDQFVRTLTEKLLTYALGRGLEYYDAPAVRRIMRDASEHDYRFSSIVHGIVNSVPFTERRAAGPDAPSGGAPGPQEEDGC